MDTLSLAPIIDAWFERRAELTLNAVPADLAQALDAVVAALNDGTARVAEKIDGMPMSLVTETVFNVPTTAHILGGCCMGDGPDTGVIDHRHRVFGYDGLYVIDGSAVSANPGVNPSLTIAALAERAMTFIPRSVDVA